MIRVIIFLAILISNIAFGQTEISTEELTIWNDSIQLPGTLTYDKTLSKQPLVIFIQGSGNPDRNGNQLQMGIKANYIKMLRDSLNQKGIAFYSFDKRNVTKANIKHLLKSMTFEGLIEDVKTTISHFKDDSRFNNITLIGHSQGSLVAMLAITEDIDNYISLAGLGEPMDKTLITQLSNQNKELAESAKAHIQELKNTGTIKDIHPYLMSIFAKPNHEFLKSYFKFDPVKEIQQIKIPILIVNGDKDIQVPVSHAQHLHEANPKSELVIITHMNHVLKQIEKDADNMPSYYTDSFPLAENLVETIANFITQ